MQSSDVGGNTDRTSTLFANKMYEYVTAASGPFFLYFASQDPHGPNMAPEEYTNSGTCATIVNPDRQVYCGQIAALDAQVGELRRGPLAPPLHTPRTSHRLSTHHLVLPGCLLQGSAVVSMAHCQAMLFLVLVFA